MACSQQDCIVETQRHINAVRNALFLMSAKLTKRGKAHDRSKLASPEFGVSGMTLVDVVDMFCAWLADIQCHESGDIFKLIRINQKRFGLSDQLVAIFENTAREIFGKIERDRK